MTTKYCYTHPMLGKRIFGPFDSRDDAARDCLSRNPVITGGGTFPILTMRNGVIIPEHNSFVDWNMRDDIVMHDTTGLQRARIK